MAKCTCNVATLRRCTLELDTSGMASEVFAKAAFAEVEAFMRDLDAKASAYGKPIVASVSVKPVPTDRLLALLAEPGLFRLEVTARGLPWKIE